MGHDADASGFTGVRDYGVAWSARDHDPAKELVTQIVKLRRDFIPGAGLAAPGPIPRLAGRRGHQSPARTRTACPAERNYMSTCTLRLQNSLLCCLAVRRRRWRISTRGRLRESPCRRRDLLTEIPSFALTSESARLVELSSPANDVVRGFHPGFP